MDWGTEGFGFREKDEKTEEKKEKVLVRDEADLYDTGRRNIELILDAKRDDYRDKGYDDATIAGLLKKDEKELWDEYCRDNMWTDEVATETEVTETDPVALANGEVDESVFRGDDSGERFGDGVRLEELTADEYEMLEVKNPEMASRLLTDYNDRMIPKDELSDQSRELELDSPPMAKVADAVPEESRARVIDEETGAEYEVYPNPMLTVNHMDGQQGQNDIGMEENCGIASTAKGINDLYGKRVTGENRLTEYAYRTGNCDIWSVEYSDSGEPDFSECGGTNEADVKKLYEANGLEADAYTGARIPSVEELGEEIKSGGVVTLAVNHDLFWNYEKAQSFDESLVDEERYSRDSKYQAYVDRMFEMQEGTGVYKADHFVNISNVVYHTDGSLKGFIVADTGTGEVKLVDKADLQRAYEGSGEMEVRARGCVVARRKRV